MREPKNMSSKHPDRRIVGAKRARVLRKRGESVWYDHTLPSGKARYSWKKKGQLSATD